MGFESSLIGEEPTILPLIKKRIRKNKNAIDAVSFGKNIFIILLPWMLSHLVHIKYHIK